jgi:phage repressor protein C with HTH and peptisase S24 domain
MLRHSDVWRALDLLAERHGLSPSGLARKAGLDPTTFNRSKRVTAEGKRRWPSTESLAKALAAVGASPADFVQTMAEGDSGMLSPRLPLIPASRIALRPSPSDAVAAAGLSDLLDENGRPSVTAARELVFPGIDDPGAFVLEIDSDAYVPVYRPGDLLIVSPAAHLRPGHRVAVRRRDGRLSLGALAAQDPAGVSLEPDERVASEEVAWMSRVLWASQ